MSDTPITDYIEETLRATDRAPGVKQKVETLERMYSAANGETDKTDVLEEVLRLAYDRFTKFGINPTWGDLQSWTTVGKEDLSMERLHHLRVLSNLKSASVRTRQELIEKAITGLTPTGQEIIYTILNHDLRCGIAESTINKAFPKLLPTFSVMLSHKYNSDRIKSWPVHAEPKYDGMRVIALVHNQEEVEFVSRNGKPVPAAEAFREHALNLARLADPEKAWVIDGEVIAGANFNDSISAARKDEAMTSGKFMVFDLLPMSELFAGKSSNGYTERREFLKNIFGQCVGGSFNANGVDMQLAPSYVVSSDDEVQQMFQQALNAGLEGLIVKPGNGLWEAKRSYNWMKLKAEETEDLPIVGAFEGTGQFEGSLGGIIVNRYGVLVEVGSGFTPQERMEFWRDIQNDLQRGASNEEPGSVIGQYVEVKYHEVTPAGSLRHPVYKRMRTDKTQEAIGF